MAGQSPMVAIDYVEAGKLLEAHFSRAEQDYLESSPPQVSDLIAQACDTIFESNTQAYRETLLGCVIARALSPEVNVRQPYVDQGEKAFSGRTLDERVINPFLQSKQIPSSKGPYLSVFRRNVQFDDSTRSGLRDKLGYDAFRQLLAQIESGLEDDGFHRFLEYLLYRFVVLRESNKIELARLQRISLLQYQSLIASLLATPSGGRIPVLLVVAMFETLRDFFRQDWIIEKVGINVADAAAGTAGDIAIKTNDGRIILSVEVTERPVDSARVQSTFRTKIAPAGLVDYLFLVNLGRVDPSAISEAERYFAQGHDLNFVDILTWTGTDLATTGSEGRKLFEEHLLVLLRDPAVPSIVRAAWNREVLNLTMQ
jgi:hypothetical protein